MGLEYKYQAAALGATAAAELLSLHVLIVGCAGVGSEVVKNLFASGVAVSIHDPTPVTIADLGANSLLAAEDVGLPREVAAAARLSARGAGARATVLPSAPQTADCLRGFGAVVAADVARSEAERLNALCRAVPGGIPFIYAGVQGAAGFAFSDFGPSWECRAPPGALLIKSSACFPVYPCSDPQHRAAFMTAAFAPTAGDGGGGPRVFTICVDHDNVKYNSGNNEAAERGHPFRVGDAVVFRGVRGATALNDGAPRTVAAARRAGQFDVLLLAGDAGVGPGWGDGEGGVVAGVPLSTLAAHAPLAERVLAPGALGGDSAKPNRAAQLHVAFAGVEAWRAAHGGALPPLRDAGATAECVDAARAFAAAAAAAPGGVQVGDVDAGVAARVGALAGAQLAPLCALLGGVAAHEAVKAVRVGAPLSQWLYWDAFEALPAGGDPGAPPLEGSPPAPASDFLPSGTRYDDALAILGAPLLSAAQRLRVLLVGAGGVGCELLRGLALLGVGVADGGALTVADGDELEAAQLPHHALLRGGDVGTKKAVAAAAAAAAINPALRATPVVAARDAALGDDDALWEGLDLVLSAPSPQRSPVAALEGFAFSACEGRGAVDALCKWHLKPLLDVAVEGAACSVQAVLPFHTRSWADDPLGGRDTFPGLFPDCVKKNHPQLPEHCVEWALELLRDEVETPAADAAAFLRDPQAWLKAAGDNSTTLPLRARAVLRALANLGAHEPEAAFARASAELFHRVFHLDMVKLLHSFPPDYVEEASGLPYWGGLKLQPSPAPLDPALPLHRAFLLQATDLLIRAFGAQPTPGFDAIAAAAAAALPPFVPRSAGDALAACNEEDLAGRAAVAKLRVLAEGLAAGAAAPPPPPGADWRCEAYGGFVAAAANLRAACFGIPPTEPLQAAVAAAGLVPALAAPPACGAGLACVELLKVAARAPPSAFCSSYLSLAANAAHTFAPAGPTRTVSDECGRALPEGFTDWDRIVVREGKDLTYAELEEWFAGQAAWAGLKLASITADVGGRQPVFCWNGSKTQRANRGGRRIAEHLKEYPTARLPGARRWVKLAVTLKRDEDEDEEFILPQVCCS